MFSLGLRKYSFIKPSKHYISPYVIRLKKVEVSVNDVIADKNAVTNIMNNSTGLQRI